MGRAFLPEAKPRSSPPSLASRLCAPARGFGETQKPGEPSQVCLFCPERVTPARDKGAGNSYGASASGAGWSGPHLVCLVPAPGPAVDAAGVIHILL